MVYESVAVGANVIELVGVAHTDEIRGDDTALALQMRHDVSPYERRGGISMKEDNGITLADLDIGHALAADGLELLLEEARRGIKM